MNNSELVKHFLAEHTGQFFCNRCLCNRAGIADAGRASQVIRPLRTMKAYRAGKVSCNGCGEYRECIALAATQ